MKRVSLSKDAWVIAALVIVAVLTSSDAAWATGATFQPLNTALTSRHDVHDGDVRDDRGDRRGGGGQDSWL